MKVALACGGTGGHIFPGLATASVLLSRGHEITLWLAGKDVERTALQDWQGPVITVPAEGFSSGLTPESVRVAWNLFRSVIQSTRLMKKNRPDVLLAMGSYASVGPVGAAFRLRVPVVLHESNVLPGRAVSLLSRRARTVAASFEETRYYLPRKNLVVTGMPLRKELAKPLRTGPFEALDRNFFTILVMGGSRGARALNDLVSMAICQARAQGSQVQVIHLSGLADEEWVRQRYEEENVPHRVMGFVQDMASVYSNTDVAICRAGAATCAEITAFGVPALLIPYPYASHDHQMANARALEKSGAADVVEEKDLSVEWLVDYIAGSLTTPGRLARMSAAARKRAGLRGAEALADVVEAAAAAPRASRKSQRPSS